MFGEGALSIELHRGGKIKVFDVQYDRALIGSGAHCDVRLAPDEAAIEQLVVQLVGDDEVFARASVLEPVCLLNGAPFIEGRLGPTSMLELGAVALCVQRTQKQDTAAPITRSGNSATSPVVQGLGLLGVIVGLYVVLQPPEQVSLLRESPSPPPRAADAAAQPCPQRDPVAASALAAQTEHEAQAKRERSPFSPAEGPASVPLFERAASCYELAGQIDLAREARAAAGKMRSNVADEIHVRHVRLERYLAQKEYAQARKQAALLSELVAVRSGPYAEWLSAVKREGELRANGAKP